MCLIQKNGLGTNIIMKDNILIKANFRIHTLHINLLWRFWSVLRYEIRFILRQSKFVSIIKRNRVYSI